jgi:hypothetical protein
LQAEQKVGRRVGNSRPALILVIGYDRRERRDRCHGEPLSTLDPVERLILGQVKRLEASVTRQELENNRIQKVDCASAVAAIVHALRPSHSL